MCDNKGGELRRTRSLTRAEMGEKEQMDARGRDVAEKGPLERAAARKNPRRRATAAARRRKKWRRPR